MRHAPGTLATAACTIALVAFLLAGAGCSWGPDALSSDTSTPNASASGSPAGPESPDALSSDSSTPSASATASPAGPESQDALSSDGSGRGPAANSPNSIAASTYAPTAPSEGGAGVWEPNASVERVVDGDTIIAEIDGRTESVRLIGIDTPETVARSRPVECYGLEASLRLQELLPAGTPITLVRDVEARDVYDRLLGYVVRSSDGLFVNLELVVGGHAATLNFPPNVHHAATFARAEAEAIAAGRGLWNRCGGPDVPLE